MAKVLMKKTVYDGNIYHRAGQEVEISGDKLKMYLQRNYATEIVQKPIEVIETKEQKIVYATKSKKRKNATNTN